MPAAERLSERAPRPPCPARSGPTHAPPTQAGANRKMEESERKTQNDRSEVWRPEPRRRRRIEGSPFLYSVSMESAAGMGGGAAAAAAVVVTVAAAVAAAGRPASHQMRGL